MGNIAYYINIIKLSEYSNYFTISHDSEAKSWIVTANDPEPIPEDLFSKIVLRTEMAATFIVTNDIAKSAIAIQLPTRNNDQIKFSKSVYSGNYTEDKQIKMNEEITLLGKISEDIEFEFTRKFRLLKTIYMKYKTVLFFQNITIV